MTKKEMFRLIADEGKILTNGEVKGSVIDVLAEKAEEWYEIDDETAEQEEIQHE